MYPRSVSFDWHIVSLTLSTSCRLLKLDLVVRDEQGNILNPELTSAVKLYRHHRQTASRSQHSEVRPCADGSSLRWLRVRSSTGPPGRCEVDTRPTMSKNQTFVSILCIGGRARTIVISVKFLLYISCIRFFRSLDSSSVAIHLEVCAYHLK